MECTCLYRVCEELSPRHPWIIHDPWCPEHGDFPNLGGHLYNLGDVYDKLFRRPNHDRG